MVFLKMRVFFLLGTLAVIILLLFLLNISIEHYYFLQRFAAPTAVYDESCVSLVESIYRRLYPDRTVMLFHHSNDGIHSISKCRWLRVPKLSKYTGIGHAVSALNFNIELALQHGLMLDSSFGLSGHELSERETDKYFGFGCAFNRGQRVPPDISAAGNVRVIKTTLDALPVALSHEKTAECLLDQHVIFDLTKRDIFGNIYTKGLLTSCDYQKTYRVLRMIFQSTNQSRMYTPQPILDWKRRGDLIVGVHIRRGDILEAHVRNKRFIPSHVQFQLVHCLMAAKRRLEKDRGLSMAASVKIHVITEQAPDSHSIWDISLISGKLTRVNVTDSMKSYCSAPSCAVRVFKDEETSALAGFSALCESDIIVTTASGFSHLAAILCPAKLVIALPFWCPYNLDSLPAESGFRYNILQISPETFDSIAAKSHGHGSENISADSSLTSDIYKRLNGLL